MSPDRSLPNVGLGTLPRSWLPRGLAVACAVATLTCAGGGHAQVNVEPLRQQVKEQGAGARARASAASYAGNTQGVIFGGSALAGVHGKSHFGYAVLNGDYAKLNGAISVAKWFGHLRHNYELLTWLWWEEYAQIESDRFRRVTLRELVGAGPRFGLLQDAAVAVFYGASYLYEHTNLDTADRSASGEGGVHRFSNYVAVTVRAQERILLSSVSYVQPRFDAPADCTVLSVNSGDFTITPRLHSRVEITARYDSRHPSDVRATDLELKNSLELVF